MLYEKKKCSSTARKYPGPGCVGSDPQALVCNGRSFMVGEMLEVSLAQYGMGNDDDHEWNVLKARAWR